MISSLTTRPAQIALVPHWMMGGIKIKHIEAISYGLAVVCTPGRRADGLPEAIGYSRARRRNAPEFAQHLHPARYEG